MARNLFFVLLFFIAAAAPAQTIPATRTVDWSVAGMLEPAITPVPFIDITTLGGNGNGSTPNDAALQQAFIQLNGQQGTIYFPAGTYLFNSSINMPDSVILRGDGSTLTTLTFNLGGNGDLIRISGTITGAEIPLAADAHLYDSVLTCASLSGIQAGDVLRLYQDDSTLVFSSWAYNSVGQILRVDSVNGNQLFIHGSLRRDYLLTDAPRFRKVLPARQCGIECLKIERQDASTGQTTNVDFNYAVDCWMKGVESNMTNFGHVVLSYSSNIEISGCYFHHAFAYGGGGQGYGVVMQYSSGECLAENNICEHLRHSFLFQAGSNGNVVAYNYSTDPNWTSFPSNSAGDIVMHGNYTFANLAEGNIVQNMIVDASHGTNGPYNTFFRNRAELYGLVMSTNPASNNQNYAGNEITSTQFLQGNYTLNGTGHFQFGNYVQGTLTPANTSALPENSLFRSTPPSYLSGWPNIGAPYTYNAGTLPAKARFQNQVYTSCMNTITATESVLQNLNPFYIFPNPASDAVEVRFAKQETNTVIVYDANGKEITKQAFTGSTRISTQSWAAGIYTFVVSGRQQVLVIRR